MTVKAVTIFLLGWACCFQSYGQRLNLDSALIAVWDYPDSVRQQALLLLSNNSVSSNSKKARLFKIIGDSYYEQDSLDKAQVYYEQALNLFTPSDDSLKTRIYDCVNYILTEQNEFIDANKKADLAIIGYNKMQFDYKLAMMFGRKAYNFMRLNNLDSSSYLYFKALSIYDSLNRPQDALIMLNNISLLLRMNQDFERGQEYLYRALALSTKYQDSVMIAGNYLNLATFHNDKSNYDSATYYAELASDMAAFIGKIDIYQRAISALGRTALETNKWDDVIKICSKIILSKEKDELAICDCNRSLSEAYFSKEDILQALSYAQAAETTCEVYGRLSHLAPVQELLYRLYKKNGQLEQALFYLEKYKENTDSIVNALNNEKIEELSAKYESNLKNQKITKLEQQAKIKVLELERQQTLIAFVIAFGLLISALVYFLLRQNTLRAKHNEVVAEQKLLRAQMNPHFLFNALTAIQKHLYSNKDITGSTQYLAKFSRLMRKVLEFSSTEFVSLQEELDLLQDYLTLQQMRLNPSFEFEIKVTKTLEKDNVLLPPMLVQPFLENAIEHGFTNSQAANKIWLNYDQKGDSLKIEVRDNGVGFDNATNKKTEYHSRATEITRSRVLLLRKHLGKKASFNVDNNPNGKGIIVKFELPLLLK